MLKKSLKNDGCGIFDKVVETVSDIYIIKLLKKIIRIK
jgi:hypothetical protein